MNFIVTSTSGRNEIQWSTNEVITPIAYKNLGNDMNKVTPNRYEVDKVTKDSYEMQHDTIGATPNGNENDF